jgi:uncharacterized protein YaiI (UPF0178 family)
MKLWIDGDSCPREALQAALDAHRGNVLQVEVVADRSIKGVIESGAVLTVIPGGTGAVDAKLIREVQPGDLVLTRDLRLGLGLMDKGATVLNDRGRVWTVKDLKLRLEEAEIMLAMRNGGVARNHRSSYTREDARKFFESMKKLAGRNC